MLSLFTGPLPSISGTIGPGAGQKPGTSRPPAVEEEPTPPPTELSGRLPPEEPRDSNYMFGEIPILAPLHPRLFYKFLWISAIKIKKYLYFSDTLLLYIFS
jgi:hypothetical protein